MTGMEYRQTWYYFEPSKHTFLLMRDTFVHSSVILELEFFICFITFFRVGFFIPSLTCDS